jgi:2-desacetyl-2-hydroxyethyl bacteriochlorophyllide A dehydrogenase
VRRRALVFTGPRRVSVIDEELGSPPPGALLVRTRVSAISAGTELLAFRGELPADVPLDETLPALAGEGGRGAWTFPFRFGYAAVGEVIGVGDGVAASDWIGRHVFSFQPHGSAFFVAAGEAWPVPDGIDLEKAALLANAETAVNLILDGGPRVGERVAVFGQGVVGLLATALLVQFPLQMLVVVDRVAGRAARGRALGASAAVSSVEDARAALADAGADLAFELTGNPQVLNDALAVTGREGRVVVGSFYGRKQSAVDLGGHFHRGRIAIVGSQVSHIAPALTARWDRQRRRDVAWQLLRRVDSAGFTSHRFPVGEAAAAYALLDADAPAALQVLLTYD